MKRTNVDFSKHVHTVETFKCGEKTIQIDHFAEPGTGIYAIHFLNGPNGLVVYGDCGSWMFCRQFFPSGKKGECVDPVYWLEKLKIGSCQVPGKYDPEETAKELRELESKGLKEYGYSGKKLKEAKMWFHNLLSEVDDELGYTYTAYREYGKPGFIDYEQIPFCKKLDAGLKCVFDAFDEMCLRMRIEAEKEVNP